MKWNLRFWKRKPSRIPNPGSQMAASQGCNCPPGQNNNGEKRPGQGWRVRRSCIVHGGLPEADGFQFFGNDAGGVQYP